MKIITKKSVIFAALAVVLLATALVISCNAPLEGNSDKEEPSKPGTGKVRLTVNTRNASRTIMPSSIGTVNYLLKLSGSATGNPVGGGVLPDYYENVSVGAGQTLSVPLGTYDSAQVFVYTGTPLAAGTFTNYPNVAIGESTIYDNSSSGFTVVSSGPGVNLGTHTNVLYKPGQAPTTVGTGTFAYNITKAGSNSGRLDTVKFTILGRGSTYSGPGSTISTDVLGAPGSLPSIPSGYYNVVFELKSKDGATVNFFDIIHVYKSLTSTFTRVLNDNYFPALSGNGDGNFDVVAPQPDGTVFTGSLNASPGTVLVSAISTPLADENYGWKVKIPSGVTSITLTLTVTPPSGTVAVPTLYDATTAPSPLAPNNAGNGFTWSFAAGPPRTVTITLDTTGSGGVFPLNTAVINTLQPQIDYDPAKPNDPFTTPNPYSPFEIYVEFLP